jgi:hypothetical protein
MSINSDWLAGADTIAMGALVGAVAATATGWPSLAAEAEASPDTYPANVILVDDGQLQDAITSIPPRQLSVTIGGTVANSRTSATTTGTTELVFQSAYKGSARKARDTAFRALSAASDTNATTWSCDSLAVALAGPAKPLNEQANVFVCSLVVTWTRRHILT